ncbi:phosphonate metabolism protein/1,5-bisphosphokinase (PRPP-forming) PhnN [Ancylobacter defluvii]|nr:phosphonate metabolism protein/1,5-bisphosphokinase (PRPP-forming) PhnN [Ancylobacter defluvii]
MGPGTLVLVVGPSGAGKDTLLSYARERLAGSSGLAFARRRITRPVDATEDHVSVDEATFQRAAAAGEFPLHWRANGLSYALGPEVAEAIRGAAAVVANGSRAAVREACARFSDVRVVLITAPPQVLAARIAARGRESAEDVVQRLKREPALDRAPELTLVNDGPPEAAGERLVAYLQRLAAA